MRNFLKGLVNMMKSVGKAMKFTGEALAYTFRPGRAGSGSEIRQGYKDIYNKHYPKKETATIAENAHTEDQTPEIVIDKKAEAMAQLNKLGPVEVKQAPRQAHQNVMAMKM